MRKIRTKPPIENIWTRTCGQPFAIKIVRDSDYVHISVIAEGWKRPLRISSLGEAYSKENIRDKLEENRYQPDMGLFHPPEKKRTPLLEATKHIPLTVIGRAEKRNTFSVVANWLIAFGGSVCFLAVRTIWFVVALLCNLVLLAVCIAILHKPWISWKQRQKQRKRELRRAQRMAGRKSNNEMIDRKKVL